MNLIFYNYQLKEVKKMNFQEEPKPEAPAEPEKPAEEPAAE